MSPVIGTPDKLKLCRIWSQSNSEIPEDADTFRCVSGGAAKRTVGEYIDDVLPDDVVVLDNVVRPISYQFLDSLKIRVERAAWVGGWLSRKVRFSTFVLC